MFNNTKLKKSAIIALLGLLIIIIPMMATNLTEIIEIGGSFDWKSPLIALVTATSTWLVATMNNFLNNK